MVNVRLEWGGQHGALTLQWDTKIEIVNEVKPKRKGTTRKPSQDGSVAFIWSNTKDQENWTNSTAGTLDYLSGRVLAEKNPQGYGDLRNAQEVPTIILDEDFTDWATYRDRVVNRRGDKPVEIRTHKCGVAVGSAVAVILRTRAEPAPTARGGQGRAEPMSPEQQDRAVTAAARMASRAPA